MQVAENMTPNQRAAYERYIAMREKLNNENQRLEQEAKAAKAAREARYAPRIVETRDAHQCRVCDETIPPETKAWYSPSRICAKSGRDSAPSSTGGRWTCRRCAEANQ